MRDGVELSSDVWMPVQAGHFPVILIRTPYLKTMALLKFTELARYFVKEGYAFAVQDVRGRGDSDGTFNFLFQEGADGYDTVEWLATRPWANGRVCMMGVSYLAALQWLAARERPPHLKCIAPTAPAGRWLNELPMVGGAFQLSWALDWLNGVSGHNSQSDNSVLVDWKAVFAHRPLLTMDEAMGRSMPLYREFLQHPVMDSYWKRLQFEEDDFRKIEIPTLTVIGWFDAGQTGGLFFWNGIHQYSNSPVDHYLIIGPWEHAETFVGGKTRVGEMTFLEDSVIDNKKLHLAFFDRYLKQSSVPFEKSHVRLYVTGVNQWREYDQYPLPGVKQTRLYLGSGGKANTGAGDGTLSNRPLIAQRSDHYTYDPLSPVPSDTIASSPASDRRSLQQRPDVLVYKRAPLTRPLEVIGQIGIELYAATDAKDTDFTGVLLDVYPDGKAVAIGPRALGIIRARYRDGYDKTELLTPNKVELYHIDLGNIAHSFLPGHSLSVEISSSAAPMFNPNQNTGNPIATDMEWRVAHQTIYHDLERPSAVVLSVPPR
jgi:putative CocE/NonD family hydrolase